MKKWRLLCFGITLSLLSSMTGAATPLAAAEVFAVQVHATNPNTFIIDWQIKPGYFLYRDRLHLTLPDKDGVTLGALHFPNASQKTDPHGRLIPVYRKQLSLSVAVLGKLPGETLLNLRYQGCADDGFCYPPETRQIKLTIDNKLALVQAEFYEPTTLSPHLEQEQIAPSNAVESIFSQHNWAVALIIFYGLGLLLAFTPCVLPMVPVLSGIIVGHGHTITTRKAFFLSLTYVLSMAITYAIAGAFVALLGSNLQVIMQTPWVICMFSGLFIVLAVSMFGYWELKLPQSWQHKLALINRHQSSGHYVSAAIMGALSTLILSPCVTAPLIGALSYIANSGNIVMGALSLFFLGLGMGTPLLLIGTSARHWLPKAGHWMNAVKYFFGVALIAVAIYLMSRIIPSALVMGLWGALLIFSGIYAGALVRSTTHHEKFKQASGIIMLVYGILILVGASMGGSNPLQPFANVKAATSRNASIDIAPLTSLPAVKTALADARGKAVMIDFYADWCETCKNIEATVFKDPAVLSALKNMVVFKINVTANNADDKAILHYFNIIAPPTFLFFDAEGHELPGLRIIGNASSADFLQSLAKFKVLEA